MERYSEPLSLAHNNSVVITSNKEKTKKLAQLSTQFEYEKKEESLRLMQKQETALLNSEIKEQKATQLATLIGLGLTLLIIVVLIIFYRSKQKSNGQLNQANAELSNYVEELTTVNENLNVAHEELTTVNESLNTTLHTVEKQRDNIMGSINYAQRIQNAILPIPERLNSALKEYFILFKPRDVVSGDFYWFDEIDNNQFIAVADCTGHGVPGAFMTMLGTQALTDIIVQKGIHKPNEILLELDKTLYKLLKSDSSRLVDGMDIVICVMKEI